MMHGTINIKHVVNLFFPQSFVQQVHNVLQSEFSTESDLVLPLSVYRENTEIKFKKSLSNNRKYYKGFWKRLIKKNKSYRERKINYGKG